MSLKHYKSIQQKKQEAFDKTTYVSCASCGSIDDYCYCNYDWYDDYHFHRNGYYYWESDWYQDWLESPHKIREDKLDELLGDKVQRIEDFIKPN